MAGRKLAFPPIVYINEAKPDGRRSPTHPPIVKAQPHDVLSTEKFYVSNAQDALKFQSQLVYDQAGCLPLFHFASLSAKFYLQVTDDLTNDDEPIDRSYKNI